MILFKIQVQVHGAFFWQEAIGSSMIEVQRRCKAAKINLVEIKEIGTHDFVLGQGMKRTTEWNNNSKLIRRYSDK